MCDQDHFEDDLKKFEAQGLVTRKQFGIMLGAGVAMLLPQVANAAPVTEGEVNVTTPDGTADCYFVHPTTGTGAGVLIWPDIFGLRPAFRTTNRVGFRRAKLSINFTRSTPPSLAPTLLNSIQPEM